MTLTITSNQTRSIVARYKKGETIREIADLFEISNSTVLRILRDNKVKIRPRGRRPAAV